MNAASEAGRRTAGSECAPRNGGERGSVLIFVAVSLLALLAIVAITIDSAIMLTTRTQLQNAADAAALAGASGLIDSGGDQAVARQRALRFASFNVAMLDSGPVPVIITDSDITFPATDVVHVRTHRTQATGDPVRVFFRRVVDPASNNRADVAAEAAAQAYDLCAAKCLKPWAVPDRWDDADGDGEYDGGELYDPVVTGYRAPGDVGASVTLKVGNPQSTVAPGLFFPVNYPPLDLDPNPLTGANWYRQWIADCEPYPVGVGDRLQVEPGNMVGPTHQGMDDLIALDPNASWDSATKTVVNSAYGISPRIALVPLFDPTLPPNSGRNWVTVAQIGAFFIEQTGAGGEVTGRFIDVTSQGSPCPGGLGSGLVKGLSLIQ